MTLTENEIKFPPVGLVDSGTLIRFPALFESKQVDNMSADKKIAELIIQQTVMISGLASIIADLITMNVASLEFCEKCKKDPVTVEHKHVKTRMCDKCAAESIVLSSKNYAKGFMENPDDPLNVVRSSLMLDENWVDVKNAEQVRRLTEYARIVEKDIDTSDTN